MKKGDSIGIAFLLLRFAPKQGGGTAPAAARQR
jgi:hypothetical protein